MIGGRDSGPRLNSLAAELHCQIDEIVGDHVEIMLGFEVPALIGSVFEWPADEGGAKPAASGRDEIAIVRRHHHALPWLEVEQRSAAVVSFGLRLVGMGDFGAEDHVPRQSGV